MTSAPVLYVHCGDGEPSYTFSPSIASGELGWCRQIDMSEEDLLGIKGLILPAAVDQIALMEIKPALESFLDRGGRMMMNCHVLRQFIDGPGIFVPMNKPKRSDFDLVRVREHPIFGDYPTHVFATAKGVAGFYGRGHNPMPDGATPIQVFGEAAVPVDWEWQRPQGGTVFNHSGNDLWVVGDYPEVRAAMGSRIVAWCKGGE